MLIQDPQTQALRRLKEITDYWQQYPGAAPGGTGATGLMPGDAKGWSDLLNQQTEAANIERQFKGEGPLDVKARQTPSQPMPSTMWDPGQTSAVTGGYMPAAPPPSPLLPQPTATNPSEQAMTPFDQTKQRQALAGLMRQRGQ